MENGKPTGLKMVEQNTALPLIEVKPENVVVLFEGAAQPVPFDQCDIVTRLGGEDAIVAMLDDPPPPPPVPAHVGKPEDLKVTLTPDEEKVVLAKLRSVRSRWPKTITLLEKSSFQSFDKGNLTGSHPVEAGATVRLLSIEDDVLVVAIDKTISEVRLSQTDLVARLGGANAIVALSSDAAVLQGLSQ